MESLAVAGNDLCL